MLNKHESVEKEKPQSNSKKNGNFVFKVTAFF